VNAGRVAYEAPPVKNYSSTTNDLHLRCCLDSGATATTSRGAALVD